MQNAVETQKNEQRYQMFKTKSLIYQGKIRKSPSLMAKWREFFKE